MTTAMVISAALLLLFVATALLLVLVGVGPMMLAPPRCAGCGHDLRTGGEAALRCPECGRQLHERGAIRFAARQRRPQALVGAMVAVVIAALAPALVMAIERATALRSGRVAAVVRPSLGELLTEAEDGGPLDWRQIARAVRTGRPTPEDAARITQLVRRDGLGSRNARSAAERFELDDACRGVLRVASEEDAAALAKAWFGPVPLVAPERVVARTNWSATLHARELVDLEALGRTAEGLPLRMEPFHPVLRLEAARLNGVAQDVTRMAAATGVVGPSIALSLPPIAEMGALVLEIDVTRIFLGSDELPRSGLPADPGHWPAPVAEERVTLTRTIQVVDAGAPLVTLVRDPSLRARMAGALEVTSCELDPSRRGSLLVKAKLVPPGGVWIAGRWRVRVGERWRDGPLIAAWGTPTNFGVKGPLSWSVPLLGEETPGHVEVIIEPVDNDPSILPRDGTPVWGERLECVNVPVTAQATLPPRP